MTFEIFYNKLLQSTVGCGQAMAECVILEAAEAANLFTEEQLDVIVERAAVTWVDLKGRRAGKGC